MLLIHENLILDLIQFLVVTRSRSMISYLPLHPFCKRSRILTSAAPHLDTSIVSWKTSIETSWEFRCTVESYQEGRDKNSVSGSFRTYSFLLNFCLCHPAYFCNFWRLLFDRFWLKAIIFRSISSKAIFLFARSHKYSYTIIYRSENVVKYTCAVICDTDRKIMRRVNL